MHMITSSLSTCFLSYVAESQTRRAASPPAEKVMKRQWGSRRDTTCFHRVNFTIIDIIPVTTSKS